MSDISVSVVVAASVVSCAIGAAGGYILTKKYVSEQYETLIAEEVEKAKAFYTEHPPTPEVEEDSQDIVDTLIEENADVVLEDSDGKVRVQYEKIALDYGAQDIPKTLSTLGEGESVEEYEQRLIDEAKSTVNEVLEDVEPELLEQIDEGGDIVTKNIFDDHGASSLNDLDREHRDSSRPYIISLEEYEDGDLGYNQNTLTYYRVDHILVDDRDQPLQINSIVGEKNLRFGNASGDMNIVYIRNDKLSIDFEVCQDLGSYAEEVLGVAPPQPRRDKGRD